LLVLAFLIFVTRVEAVIMVAIPVGSVIAESKLIVVAKVESLDAEKLQMVLSVAETLKGKADAAKLPVLLNGDAEATKGKQVPELLKRLQVGTPIVLFINPAGEREFRVFGYTEGTWFAMNGIQPKEAESPRWSWAHFEPYLRRTYKGSTAEMRELVADVLAGKKKAPEVDNKVAPGIGPEIEKNEPPKEKEETHRDLTPPARRNVGGPLFAVIPSVLVGGPLAFLAMLFPAVFGGLILVAKRWMVALTVVSTNTTLFLLHSWFVPPTAWWASALYPWLAMTLVTFLGALWTWQRYTTALFQTVSGSKTTPTPAVSPLLACPREGEVVSLIAISAVSAIVAYFCWPHSFGQMSPWDKTLAVILLGVVVATVHVALVFWRNRGAIVSPRLPGEGVLLLAMLFASIAFLPTLTSAEAGEVGPNVAVVNASGDDAPKFTKVAWRFRPAEPSWIASSPVVAGNRVYVGAVHGAAFRSGALYSVDLNTGKVVATFNNGGKMKDVFCSPTVADGCVYVGEGFHQHSACNLFCLDAETLEKKWEFATGSHTESTPCVVSGKVYFGAGDDGLYCLDAKTGKEVWHLNGLHIDANPLVVDGKVYVGSGKGDVYSALDIVCLDAETGKEVWRRGIDQPSWGGACLAGELLIVGMGNGNFLTSEEKPAGAILALNAKTGKRIWQTDMKDGIHVRLATDGSFVWAASRDQRVICLSVAEGKKVWERDMGAPVVASPALVPYLTLGSQYSTALGEQPRKYPCGASLIVAAAGDGLTESGGKVTSLDARTGQPQWTFDVGRDADSPFVCLFSSPGVVMTVEQGVEKRRILFGCGLNSFAKGILYCLEDERKP
jgi:outer membrane protein assembly factor BamB